MESKKGSISDLPFIMGGIFSVAITVLVVTLLLNNLNAKIQDTDIFDTPAKAASDKMTNDFPEVMDGGVLFIFFCMVIISLVLASLVPVHPVFLVFFLLEWVLLIYVGGAISNTYQTIIESPVFVTEAGQYVVTSFFFRYFPYVIGIVGAILAIIMYKTKQRIMYG